MKPVLIDYRNAKYQGFVQDLQPQGFGIALDERMHFIAGSWQNGVLSGRAVVFYSHCKYIYGEWEEGVPHGLNVFRMGDTIMFACYDRGAMFGEFLVIFQEQQLAFRVELRGGTLEIREKRTDQQNKETIREMIDKARFARPMSDEFYDLVEFIGSSFVSEDASRYVALKQDQGLNFFGFVDGLGIIFDNDNFVRCVGVLNEKLQPRQFAGKYSASLSEEGNFQSGELVKYTSRQKRPLEHLTKIFRKSQAKSMTYYNNYVSLDATKPLVELEALLKNKLLGQVAQQQLEDTHGYSPADLNDSLEYQARNKNDGERLRRIREELYRSIRRPGADLSASPLRAQEYRPIVEIVSESSPYRNLVQKENLRRHSHYQHPPIEPVPAIAVDRKELIEQNRIQDYLYEHNVTAQILEGQILYDNIQQRRERLLSDYRNLRSDNHHIRRSPPKQIGFAFSKYESPGKKLQLDTQREILNAISSSRHVVPVLHQNPRTSNVPNKTSSPLRQQPSQHTRSAADRKAGYRDIHLKTPEQSKEVRPFATTPIREQPHEEAVQSSVKNHQSPAPTAPKENQRNKSTAKKYNYLEGMNL